MPEPTPDQKVGDYVDDCRSRSQHMRAEYEVKWLKYFKMYRSYLPAVKDGKGVNVWPYRSKAFIPLSWETIETAAPNILMPLIEQKPWVPVAPVEPRDVDNAKLLQKLIQYQLETQAFTENASRICRNMVIYGSAWAFVPWRREVKQVQVPGQDGQSQQVVTFDVSRPECLSIDIADIYPDPDARTPQTMKWIMQRKMLSVGDIEQMVQDGVLQRGIQDPAKYGSVSRGSDDAAVKSEEGKLIPGREGVTGIASSPWGGGITVTDKELKRDTRVETWWYWEPERLIVTTDQKEVLRDGPSPYMDGELPFILCRLYPSDNELYGISVIESISDIQHVINATTNARVDNVLCNVHSMWKRKLGSIIADQQLVWGPNKFVDVMDMNDIQPLERQDVTQSSYTEVMAMKQHAATASGVSDMTKGAQSPRGETATEVNFIQQAIGMRFALSVLIFGEQFIANLGRKMWSRNLQFMTQAQSIRLQGPDGFEFAQISRDNILGSFDFVAESNVSRENEALRQQTLVNAMSVLNAMEAQKPGSINMTALVREFVDTLKMRRGEQIVIEPQMAVKLAIGEATLENESLMASGQMANPRPSELHEIHLQVHSQIQQNELQDEAQLMVLQAHLQVHLGYYRALNKSAGQVGGPAAQGPTQENDTEAAKANSGSMGK